MTLTFRCALLTGAALAALSGVLASASAQDEGAPAARQGVDVITVTAQRRAENLQDVPVAITAVSAEEIETQQLDEITDLRFTSPNVNIQKNTGLANGAQVYIRGVGQDESSLFAEVGVGIYLDGVYLGKQNGTTLDLIDVERVEILRGPQGTYYGRNTNGGAIKFVTRRPELAEDRSVIAASAGSLGRLDVRGSYSAPIVENTLGFKLDGFWRSQDSDFDLLNPGAAPSTTLTYPPDSDANDLRRYGGRASLLWTPSETVSLYVVADYTQDSSSTFLPTPIQRFTQGTSDPSDDQIVEPFGRRAGEFSLPPYHEFSGGGISAELVIDTALGEITSITAYREFEQDTAIDLDGPGILDLYQELDQEQFSQEIQLVGSREAFDYILGVYYFDETANQLADNAFNQIFAFLLQTPYGLNDDEQNTQSWAVFGEGTWNATERLALTLGGRFTSDEKDAVRRLLDPATRTAFWETTPTFEDENVSWRAVAEFEANEDVLLYASYSTGYKAGGFAGTRPLTPPNSVNTYEPEEIGAFEIGLRSDLLDDTLRFNATYFYSDYEALQLSVLEPTTLQFGVINADAIVQGVELEYVWRPLDQLTLSGNTGFSDFEYDEGSRVDPAVGVPFDTLDGKQFPDFSTRLNAVWSQPASFGAVELGGSVTHSSSFPRNVANSPAIVSDELTTVDLFLAVSGDDGWRFALEGKNITDEDYFLAGTNPASGDGSFGGRYYAPGALYTASMRLEF